MKARRVLVTLTREEYAALLAQAKAERRDDGQQASYLLAKALRTEVVEDHRQLVSA